MKNKNSLLLFFLLLVSVFGIGRLFDNGRMMIPEFTVPYFSGAALLHQGEGWKFNLNEVDSLHAFQSIPDKKESVATINAYRFASEDITARTYSINQPGYLYISWFARNVFRWTGDIGAVKQLQLLFHTIVSLLILFQLKSRRHKILFFLLYAVNPFIIYYAVYPFYYFWELIPSAIFLYYYLSNKKATFSLLLLVSIFLAFLFHVRSSVLLISILTLIYASGHLTLLRRSAILFLYLFLAWVFQPGIKHKDPGHIMYTSLGAYPNSYVKNFSDTIPWNAYRKASGIEYSYTSTPGMYDASIFFAESEWCLSEYKIIVKKEPLMIARNAVLNFFQSFSFGYFRTSLGLSYLSAFFGLIIFSLMIYHKQFKLLLAIISAGLTFCIYLAPLPIYLYGSYVLIVIALIQLVDKIIPPKA